MSGEAISRNATGVFRMLSDKTKPAQPLSCAGGIDLNGIGLNEIRFEAIRIGLAQ
jgi:hypothetical protein